MHPKYARLVRRSKEPQKSKIQHKRLFFFKPKLLRRALGILILIVAVSWSFQYWIPSSKAYATPWSSNHGTYGQRKQLTLVNNSGQTFESGTTYKVTIDTASLYNTGSLLSTCDDLRVVYQPSDTTAVELKRNVEFASSSSGITTCGTSSATKVVFQLQSSIANAGTDANYYLYYDNSQATTYSSSDALDAYNVGAKEATFVAPFNGTTTALAAGSGTPTTATGAIRYSGGKSALSFDGVNDYVEVGSNSSLDISDSLTMEAWVMQTVANADVDAMIVYKTNQNYSLRIYQGKVRFVYYAPGASVYSTTNADVTPGIWHHIVFVYVSGSPTSAKIYVDGTERAGSWTVGTGATPLASTSSTLRIGGGLFNQYYSGLIDEVRISNTVRYTSAFTPSTTPFVRDEYTKLLLHFDENGEVPYGTSLARDDSGNNNHGTITGAKYVGGLVGVDGSSSNTSYQSNMSNQSYGSHDGVFIEEGTTNKITNPSFDHTTYNTNWSSPSVFDYDSTADTFTAGMAKRNSAGPFASGVVSQGKQSDATGPDSITVSRGTQISGEFYQNVDAKQGSVVFWITPEWNGNDGQWHTIWHPAGGIYLRKTPNNMLAFSTYWENGYIAYTDVSSWTAGTTYNVVARWDTRNTFDGSNFISLTVNDVTTFGSTLGGSGTSINYTNFSIGESADHGQSANAIIEGLTIYRRPLFDGTYGIDVGNGDEINLIYNSGTGKDPTLVTGSWDVVFALPTNSSTGSLATGTGNAWSHPHSSNLLYTSTTNTGGFMMNGYYGAGPTVEFNGSTSYISAGSDSSIDNLPLGTNLQIEGWFLANNTTSTILSKGYDSAGGWAIYISSGTLRGLFSHTTAHAQAFAGTGIPDSKWHHFVVDYVSATKTARVAVDGVWGTSGTGVGEYMSDSARSLILGRRADAGAWYLDGSIGWTRISNTQRYTPGTGFTPPNLPPAVDGNTIAQWNMSEGSGTTLDNAEGTAAMDGVISNGTWRTWFQNKETPTYGTGLATSEKIYGGGIKITSDATNEGTYSSFTATNGGDYVLRALGHSDGTCNPKIQITRADGTTVITSLAGTTTSTRTAPNVYIFTWESPAAESEQVQLINTASSGTCYWHQVEVLSNLIKNPSMETGSGDPWIPSLHRFFGPPGAGELTQSTTVLHSGNSSLRYSGADINEGIFVKGTSATEGSFASIGMWASRIAGSLNITAAEWYSQYSLATTLSKSFSSTLGWEHFVSTYRKNSSVADELIAVAGATDSDVYLDDVYQVALSDVSLTVTPATEANSLETSGLRVDGSDTLTQPIDSLTATSGTIKFKFTPRHSLGVIDKFGFAATQPHIISLWYSGTNYLNFTAQSTTSARINGVFNGVQVYADWTSATLNAGTTYDVEMSYLTGGNLVLKVNGSQVASTSMGTNSFGTVPTIAYFGTNSGSTYQYDATFSAPDFTGTVTPTENTTAPYYKFGSKSLKLVASADGRYVTSINPGNTNTHTLSAYVYDGTTGNVGGTVSATVAKLVFNGNVVTPASYTDVGGGWWRLTYSAATAAEAGDYGIAVLSGKTIYVDGVQLEDRYYATTYADGSFGNGYSWSGTASDSTSSRNSGDLIYSPTNNIVNTQGSFSFWVKPNWNGNDSQSHTIIDTSPDPGCGYLRLYKTTSNALRIYDGCSNYASIGASWSANTWQHVVGVWGTNNLSIYVNGIAGTASSTFNQRSITSMYIGRSNAYTDSGNAISDFKIYSSAITSTEVADLYYSGLGSHSSLAPVATERYTDGEPPVLAWHLNEGYGTTAYDTTIYQNSGTISGATWSEDSGQAGMTGGKSLKFDGTNDYISRAYTNDPELNPGTSPFSVSTWFKHPSTVSGTDTLISRYSSTGSGGGYKVYMNSSGYICFGVDDDTTWGPDDSACTTVSYADSNWHHVLAIKGTSTIAVYIDGTQKASTTFTVSSSLSGSSPTFYTGIDSDGTSNPWDGFIDEVRVYNSARSEEQINQEYIAKGTNKGVSAQFGSGGASDTLTKGLVGHWKMDESSWNGTAGEVLDASGNAYNGVSVNGVTTATGMYGNGGSFDGSNDYVNLPTSIGNLVSFSGFTISAWVKTTSSGTRQVIFNNNTGVVLELNGVLAATLRSSGAWNNYNSGVGLSANTWYLVTLTHIDNDNFYLYLNGKQVLKSPVKVSYVHESGLVEYLGKCFSGVCGGDYPWNGQLDDFRIYNRALSPVEVRALYDYAPGPVAHLKLDEHTGNIAYDSSGNGKNASFVNNPSWTDGKFGSSLSFNGSSNYISSNINLQTPGQATKYSSSVSLWFYPLQDLRTTSQGLLTSEQSDSGGAFRIYSTGDNRLYFSQRAYGYPYIDITNDDWRNKWIHLEFTMNAGTQKVYINGIERTQVGLGSQNVNWGVAYIGRTNNGGVYTYFNGLIDDVRIYNYARTQKQIVMDMNAGHPAVGSPVGSAVAHYKFDEGQGTTARNYGSGGSTLNGTLTNMSSPATSTSGWTNDGKFSKAVNFDGSNDYVTVPDNSAIGLAGQNMTLSTWIYPTSIPTTGNWTTFLAKSSSSNGDNGYYFEIGNSGNLVCQVRNATTSVAINQPNNITIPNQWYHLICTYDGSQLAIYVNGVKKYTQSGSITLTNGGANLEIGKWTANNRLFAGSIDEVKIYNYALSEDEVKLEYNQGKAIVMGSLGTTTDGKTASNAQSRAYCPPGNVEGNCAVGQDPSPKVEYLFEESGGSSYNNTGSLASAINGYFNSPSNITRVSGKQGKAINNCSNCVSQASSYSPDLEFAGVNGLTLSAWIKGSSSENDDGVIVSKPWNAGGDYNYYLMRNANGTLTLRLTGAWSYYFSTSQTVNNNQWHYVSATVDGNTREVAIYIDGRLSNRGTHNVTNWTTSDTNEALAIGCIYPYTTTCQAGSSYAYNGSIDQVRIYNYARTPAQIAWDYNGGAPMAWYRFDECSGTVANNAAPVFQGDAGNDGTITIGASGTQTSAGTCSSGNSAHAWNNGTTGKLSSSMSFDGTDDYVSQSNLLGSAGSVCMWINPTYTAGTRAEYYFANLNDGSNFFTLQNWSDGKSYWGWFVGGVDKRIVTTKSFPTGWFHSCYNWDAATGITSLYWNGNKVGSTTNLTSVYSLSFAPHIGALNNAGSPESYYAGGIDDVRIYNYALSDAQVKLVYNNGAVSFK